MTVETFVPFGKIPRLMRDCVITEKIDGTNASVDVDEAERDKEIDRLGGMVTELREENSRLRA